LPSEAEWEYAARAGCTTAFNVGGQCSDKVEPSQANFHGNYSYNGSSKGAYLGKTAAVGSYAANNWGLHDMHGNVWEWVQDVWHDNYAGAPVDGSGWTTGGDPTRRVIRGGSWNGIPQDLRSANRGGDSPGGRSNDLDGFRLARTVS
jgi:formylglycine-generating enzyme required for sulfatase activity